MTYFDDGVEGATGIFTVQPFSIKHFLCRSELARIGIARLSDMSINLGV